MLAQKVSSRIVVLFLTCVCCFAISCRTAGPPTTLPEELASLPEPKVMDFDEVTEEILQQEVERSTAEGVLVVRYPEADFERLYGGIQPLEEQDWWKEREDGLTVEEYRRSLSEAGQTYLAVTRKDGQVYVNRQCWTVTLEKICLPIAEPLGCLCLPGQPDDLIPRDPGVACDAGPIVSRGTPCDQRTQCSTGCKPFQISTPTEGYLCDCPDELPFG